MSLRKDCEVKMAKKKVYCKDCVNYLTDELKMMDNKYNDCGFYEKRLTIWEKIKRCVKQIRYCENCGCELATDEERWCDDCNLPEKDSIK